MQPRHNANNVPLIDGLEEVNAAVQVVDTAWRHFSVRQEIGDRCEMTARQLAVARSLLTEAIEDWAMAVGRLLNLARREGGMDRLTENLEHSLRCAAAYLGGLAAIDDPRGLPNVRFLSR